VLQSAAECCNVLHCVAVCCSVLQYVACCLFSTSVAIGRSTCVAARRSMLQCVAKNKKDIVLQCAALISVAAI